MSGFARMSARAMQCRVGLMCSDEGLRLGRFMGQRIGICLIIALLIGSMPQFSAASDTSADVRARWVSAISSDNTRALQSILTDAIAASTDAPNPQDPFWELAASNGKNALMVASKVGDEALARRLVALGVDIKDKTITDGTAFMFAVLGDQQPLASWLLTLGADINAIGSNGWTSAMIAAAKGLDETLAWLLHNGANANTPDVYGFSPLMRASDNGHAEAVKLLLGEEDIDVHWQDELNNTALHYAVSAENIHIVQQLLQAGALPSTKNRSELSALDIARQAVADTQVIQVQKEQRKAVLALLEGSDHSND